jgi:hypothetical protein
LGTETIGVGAGWRMRIFTLADWQAKDTEINIKAVSKNLFPIVNYFESKIVRIKVIPYPNKF